MFLNSLQTDSPQGIISLAGATITKSNSKKEYGFDIIVSIIIILVNDPN